MWPNIFNFFLFCSFFTNEPLELPTDTNSNVTVVFLTCCDRH